MTITIIGGRDFVGIRLVKRLCNSGYTAKITDKRKNVAYPDLWVRCDVRNAPGEINDFAESITDVASALGKHDEAVKAMPMKSLLEILKGSDVVINLSAEHRDNVTLRALYDDVNVQGNENILVICTELGIQKVVFTSAVAVYEFVPVGTDEKREIYYFNDYGRTNLLIYPIALLCIRFLPYRINKEFYFLNMRNNLFKQDISTERGGGLKYSITPIESYYTSASSHVEVA